MDQIDPLGEATGRLFAGLALDARRLSSSAGRAALDTERARVGVRQSEPARVSKLPPSRS